MQYKDVVYKNPEARSKATVRQIHLAKAILKEALQTVMETNPHLEKIEMRGTTTRSINGEIEFGCVIVVHGETQEEADRHCMDMLEQGCACQSVGDKICECDCGEVE